MASKNPFDFAKSNYVASIPCTGCGNKNNMYCFRRSPVLQGERQWFYCAGCANEIERTVGLQQSDASLQAEVERSLGMRPPAG
jgi:hypothetical protein